LPVPDRPCYGAQDLENFVATYDAPARTKLGSSYLYSDIGFGVLGHALPTSSVGVVVMANENDDGLPARLIAKEILRDPGP